MHGLSTDPTKRLGLGCLSSNMPVLCFRYMGQERIKENTLNPVNQLQRRLLHLSNTVHFILATPRGLTSPLPQYSPQALTEWSLGLGETKMAPDNGCSTSNPKRKDSAITRLGLSVSVVY